MRSRPARSEAYPWYDSVWLTKYARAKGIVAAVRPEALEAFLDAFRILHTSPGFEVRVLERVVDEEALSEIRRVVRGLRPGDLELHEARRFGRFVVHDHPCFTALQRELVPVVSECVGEPVEPSYNFLSLYGQLGVCPPHMDSPQAKWTLDLCLAQSEPWPIHFSQVCPWPESPPEAWRAEDWETQIKRSPALRFTPFTLAAGQAVVFSGSSQWHYRDAIEARTGRSFAELLFLHYIPAGTADLLRPETWAARFGIPELADAV